MTDLSRRGIQPDRLSGHCRQIGAAGGIPFRHSTKVNTHGIRCRSVDACHGMAHSHRAGRRTPEHDAGGPLDRLRCDRHPARAASMCRHAAPLDWPPGTGSTMSADWQSEASPARRDKARCDMPRPGIESVDRGRGAGVLLAVAGCALLWGVADSPLRPPGPRALPPTGGPTGSWPPPTRAAGASWPIATIPSAPAAGPIARSTSARTRRRPRIIASS